jgi:alcohol dehydrogenase (cytochrome c)
MTRIRGNLAAAALGVALVTIGSSAFGQASNEWPTYGGDYSNTRYSTLNQINTGNVGKLKMAWLHSLGTLETQEATPLVIGDTMYVSTSTGPRFVFALDAKTGKTKWKYEPELPGDFMATVCCGLDSRGVSYANGMIFLGTLTARLIALDANTGKEMWNVQVMDYKTGHAITSPPLVYKNLVVTGIAGGEYGIRGFVEAFDQKTGKSVWKTYTIPGAGEAGNDTWKGDSWKNGAGSTWYVGSYDPKLNLIYWSTSNAGPWGGQVRGNDSSDIGQYTNQWTSSQLAFDADTGKIAWGYQYTPSDVWDYDGVNEAVLTDLNIGGQKQPALLHADRNGMFYVINRQSGKLLAADPFVTVNWNKGIDAATGRPIEDPAKRPRLGVWARNVCPNLIGGKNWSPMSLSAQTGLAYLPAFNMCMDIANKTEEYTPGKFYLASEFNLDMAGAEGKHLAEMMAWDPVAKKKVWSIQEDLPFVSGAMSTAGGLMFYGNQQGEVKAVDAKNGKVLWQFKIGTGIIQSPMTYSVGGKQYLAVVGGRSKGPPSFFGKIGQRVVDASPEGGILAVFELGN